MGPTEKDGVLRFPTLNRYTFGSKLPVRHPLFRVRGWSLSCSVPCLYHFYHFLTSLRSSPYPKGCWFVSIFIKSFFLGRSEWLVSQWHPRTPLNLEVLSLLLLLLLIAVWWFDPFIFTCSSTVSFYKFDQLLGSASFPS